MSVCPVCAKDIGNLRKHASGKFHNNPDDYEHLSLALRLSPGALAYLRDNLEEVHDESGRDAGSRGEVVGGHGGDEGADSDTGREPSPSLARLLERGRAAEAVAGEATDIEVAADSGGQPRQEPGDTGGIDAILDRLLAGTRKPLAESEDAAPDDKSARITELAAEVARLSDHDHELDLVSEWARGLTRGAYLELGVKLGYVEEVPVEDSAGFH